MPSTSRKQHNFMEAIAHNKGFAKKVGVPQSVGRDFSKADKGKTFKEGGDMKKMAPGGMPAPMDPRMMAMKRRRPAMPAPMPAPMQGMARPMGPTPTVGMKKGGVLEKLYNEKQEMKRVSAKERNAKDEMKRIKGEESYDMMKKTTKKMAMGGMTREMSKGEHPVQKQAKRGAEMVKMARGGLAAGHKSADGIAKKGKTHPVQVKMNKGGMGKKYC